MHCRGKMKVDELEAKVIQTLSSGKYPLFVNTTCGTTVLGAYDPVEDIADVCERYNIWLHIDVCNARLSYYIVY